MSLPQGSYTLFSFLAGVANLAGNQNVNFAAGQDFFHTAYWVPMSIFNAPSSRAIVLSWQSKDEGTVNVDLDLVVAKYAPNYNCTSSCCTAYASIGPCGAVRVMYDSTTSDGVEEAFMGEERVTPFGPYFSYLVYVRWAPPGNKAQLKRSNAQVRVHSADLFYDAEASFDLTFSPTQLADSGFLPTYWPVFCFRRDSTGVITYKDLKNTTTSAFKITEPKPVEYCT